MVTKELGFLAFIFITGLITGCQAGCGGNGVSIGKLKGHAKGEVFVVNSTALQIVGFTINVPPGQLRYFAMDPPGPGEKLTELFLRDDPDDLVIHPMSAELQTMKNARIIINVPSGVQSHNALILADGTKIIASVSIPSNLHPPASQQLAVGLKGWLYKVASGPMLIQDARTIIIPSFSFQGNKPPDGWIFAGKLGPDGKVHGENGKKAFVIGRDSKSNHVAMTELYDGSKTIAAILDNSQSVCDIEFIGVYCYAVGVDFGHTELAGLIDSNIIPPYIPPIAA